MTQFNLDAEDKLVENPYLATLYFDIKTGPLENSLIYEYGGKTLDAYFKNNNDTFQNNIHIMQQLFKILYDLSQKDIMHNDIKSENLVYDIGLDGLIKIKLIDFGSGISIKKLDDGYENFQRRTNMNTPETIMNYLYHNNIGVKPLDGYNKFYRWYYYPFISIMYYLFTGNEYSTGSINYFKNNIKYKNSIDYKQTYLSMLMDNNILKTELKTQIIDKYIQYKDILTNLIDMICIPNPTERMDEKVIIDFLSKIPI